MTAAAGPFFCVWTGQHIQSAGQTRVVVVSAHTSVRPEADGGEGGVDFVRFTIQPPTGSPIVMNIENQALWEPDCNTVPSPCYRARNGKMTEVWAYGFELEFDDYDEGDIEVTAEVHSVAGTVTTIVFPWTKLVFHNQNTPPNTKVLYVNGNTGNDSNPGTISQPKRTPRAAQNVSMNNPAGSSSSDREIGGSRIVLQGPCDYELWGDYSAPSFHCSNHWWQRIDIEEGCTLTRMPDYPDFYINVSGAGAGTEVFLHFRCAEDVVWFGDGLTFFSSSDAKFWGWMEGGQSGSILYDESKPWSVLYAGGAGSPFDDDGASTQQRWLASCHTRRGATGGLLGWSYQQDVLIRDVSGVLMQSVDPLPRDNSMNVEVERHRYATNEQLGYISVLLAGVATISVPSAGVMRITSTGTLLNRPYNTACTFPGQLDELVGSDAWMVIVGRADGESSVDFPTFDPANAGNKGHFPVIGVGANYVDLSNPSAVAETCTSGIVRTCDDDGTLFTTRVHTDIIQFYGARTDCVHVALAARDVLDLRGYADGGALTRCGLINCSDGGAVLNNDFGSNLIDCLFFNNTLGHWNFSGSSTCTGSEIVDNVCHHATNMPTAARGAYTVGNHFMTGSTFGDDATSGSWYAADPLVSPFSLAPASGRMDDGVGALAWPPAWYWGDEALGRTQGVKRSVGEFWSSQDEEPDSDIAGSAAGTATTVATLRGIGALSGSAAGAASGSCNVGDASTMSGSAAGAATATATLIGSGAIAGGAAGAATVLATLRDGSEISGAAAGVATTSATLVAHGALAGSTGGSSICSATLVQPDEPEEPEVPSTPALTGSAAVEAALAAAITSPAAASGDSGSVTAHKLSELIAAHKHLRAQEARRRGGLGIGIRRIVPPGAG